MNKVVFLTILHASTASAADLSWVDGAPYRQQHLCWMGIWDPIPEDLAWVWTGFQGLPRANEVYYGRIIVGGLGCSGLWVRPEVKLPPNTSFAIDAQHPIRCFYGTPGAAPSEVAGDCPSGLGPGYFPNANAGYPAPAGNGGTAFWGFSPKTQAYWPLPAGKILYIHFPLVTTSALNGFAANHYLLGAVNMVDMSPGNPSPIWVGHQSGWTGAGLPDGPRQGVFVQAPAPPPGDPPPPVVSYMAYPQPASRNATQTTVDLSLYYFNPACLDTDGGTPGAQIRQDLLLYKVVDGVASAPVGVSATPNGCTDASGGANGAEGYECAFTVSGLEPDTTYLWKTELIDIGSCVAANVVADFPDAGLCGTQVACGPGVPSADPPGADSEYREFRTLPTSPPPPLANILTLAQGPGTISVAPSGGRHAPGVDVTVNETPATGAHFQHWLVDNANAGNASSYVLRTDTVDHTIVAVFASDPAPPATPPSASTGSVAVETPPGDAKPGEQPSPIEEPKRGCAATGGELGALTIAVMVSRRARRTSTRAPTRRG